MLLAIENRHDRNHIFYALATVRSEYSEPETEFVRLCKAGP